MTSSLVGSEMCIRDRPMTQAMKTIGFVVTAQGDQKEGRLEVYPDGLSGCLLYTSDAADDM
eukprot:638784-Prorocentrum_lima.AAC.1